MFQVLSRPSSWHDVVYGLLTGDSSWFLITLFLCQMLALAMLMLRLPIWLQMLVSIAAALLVPPSAITVFYRPFVDLPFVVAGMWFSDKRIAALEKSKVRFVWVAFAVLLAIQLAAVKAWGEANRWDELPLGILGTAMLVFLSLGIHHSMLEKILGWYGEASLGIFVLAPYWQGLGREFVTRILHTTNPLPYLLLTTIVAATAPALIWSMKERWHIGWLFQWPEPKPAMKMEGQPGVI